MSVQLIVRIPEQQKLFLQNMANQQNLPVSKLVRDAIEGYLREQQDKENVLLKLADIGEQKTSKNAPKNLSTKYKDYLYKD